MGCLGDGETLCFPRFFELIGRYSLLVRVIPGRDLEEEAELPWGAPGACTAEQCLQH